MGDDEQGGYLIHLKNMCSLLAGKDLKHTNFIFNKPRKSPASIAKSNGQKKMPESDSTVDLDKRHRNVYYE